MAMVPSSMKDTTITSSFGGVRIRTAVLTLVDGACDFNHGFNTVYYANGSPVAATNGVAVQTITATGFTIPTEGWPKNSNGITTFKSNEGASTIQIFVIVFGA